IEGRKVEPLCLIEFLIDRPAIGGRLADFRICRDGALDGLIQCFGGSGPGCKKASQYRYEKACGKHAPLSRSGPKRHAPLPLVNMRSVETHAPLKSGRRIAIRRRPHYCRNQSTHSSPLQSTCPAGFVRRSVPSCNIITTNVSKRKQAETTHHRASSTA